jgi:hypothetical protein
MAQLDTAPFFDLLHSMIRHSDATEEVNRAERVMHWLSDKFSEIDKVIVSKERALLMVVWEHWEKYKHAPSRLGISELVAQKEKAEPLKELLLNYDDCVPDYVIGDAYDMNVKLEKRVEDWNKVRLVNMCQTAIEIAVGSVPDKNPKLPAKHGNADAMEHLLNEMQRGIFVGSTTAIGGSFLDTSDIEETYKQISWDAAHGSLVVRTGLTAIDEIIGGLKKQELIEILGFAGQRKTSLARTICYNAAHAGFRVLHLPLEQSYEEEKVAYAMIHAHNERFGKQSISKRGFDTGTLKPDEEKFLFKTVLPHMENKIGDKLIIRQLDRRTWADIKNAVEMESRVHPIDIVLVDYLSLVDVSTERNSTEAINQVFKQAKAFALTHDQGKGLIFMTPVQGSRDGYDRAKGHEGCWDASGIYMYSEAEKSADTILYVYSDDDMKPMDHVKVGTCKCRRSGDVSATICMVNGEAGSVTNHRGGGSAGHRPAPDLKNTKKDSLLAR